MAVQHIFKYCLLPVYRIVFIQFIVTLVLGVAACLLSVHAGVSVLLGGLISVASNAVFVWRFFRRGNSQSAQDLLRDAYSGAFSKLLLATVLFVIVLTVVQAVNILFLFAGFFVAQTVNWAAPIVFKRQTLG